MAYDLEKSGDSVAAAIPTPSPSDTDTGFSGSWTPEEERRTVLKMDLIVLPILMFAFFTLQLDRANMGNALTDNFLNDVGISQNTFNVGQQLLNVGIVLFEIPSNMILYRVGAKIWLTGQIFAWGLVATFQAFQASGGVGAFMATRLLLGLMESGFIPGGLYTLSLWYRPSELSKRFALYFMGNGLATASGGLLSYGILQMRGVAGLTGWQWLFILEGLLTIFAGFVFLSLFPGSPENPVSLLKVRFFTEREELIMRERISLEERKTIAASRSIRGSDILRTLRDVRLWPHLLLTVVGLAPSNALWSYAPTIVASFGYGRLESNALTSIPQWISLCLVLLLGYMADLSARRGWLVLGATLVQFIFTLAYRCLPDHASSGVKFAVFTLSVATCSWWHALNGSWLSINARSPAERSIRMACFIMSANCAGIIGAQLFRSDDKPYYHRGWTISVVFIAFAMVCAAVSICLYAWSNAKLRKGREAQAGSTKEKSTDGSEALSDFQPYNY